MRFLGQKWLGRLMDIAPFLRCSSCKKLPFGHAIACPYYLSLEDVRLMELVSHSAIR
jgi:Flp pilus assembly protein protease CpaA